ncbi:MAG: formate dehydrogenase accessory sulfurtransferase FdhD [Geobacteraceae bacterium]|nr:formate dehydrogenase accessory sulfurtransferase FdhD [Geobacteraceae bacterium]
MSRIWTYSKGEVSPEDGEVVAEFPVPLTVNGREIATLVASPHDLNYLVAGFMRLQGFVSSSDDFELFSVCKDFGAANVRIKGELPVALKPFLTSGCGTGITFTLPAALKVSSENRFTPEQILFLMDSLAKQADRYRTHGGIHSAAVGDGERMILYAEDLGRHNTVDRIAGEALFKGIDLSGLMMVTSGRVSTEMAAKAAQLGIALIASRTSPTDMAVKLCEESGITLIGYVRGGRFQIYSYPDRVQLPLPKIAGVAGAILAGGQSSRMGRNKALLPIHGRPIIEEIYRKMAGLFKEVVIVTNSPEDYAFLPCPKIPDIHMGKGSMAGVHAALEWSPEERIFVVACDMPFLDPIAVRAFAARLDCETALVPCTDGGFEPLHSFYSKKIAHLLDEALQADRPKILDLLQTLDTRFIPADEVARISPGFRSFINLNRPEEYDAIGG